MLQLHVLDGQKSVLPSLCVVNLDHYTFVGNCPPTPPLSQDFALSEK